jgi:cytoskeletal protein CcmA (bactofilin family)
MRFALIPLVALSSVAAAASEPVETITSDVSVAASARAESVHSLSGAIFLQRNSRVTGDVETGNGEIVVEPGSDVAGKLSNTTGTIRIDGARVGGLVSTTYGDIYIGADSRLDGGILVHKRNVIGLSLGDDLKLGIPVGRSTPPRVVIGPRATVAGVLRFKREVKLLVSESATIGPVEGAKPVMFATDQPPE